MLTTRINSRPARSEFRACCQCLQRKQRRNELDVNCDETAVTGGKDPKAAQESYGPEGLRPNDGPAFRPKGK